MRRLRSRLAVFYGLQRATEASRRRSPKGEGKNEVEVGRFWLHRGSFGIYEILIGYFLLHWKEGGFWPLAKDALAAALHFVTPL